MYSFYPAIFNEIISLLSDSFDLDLSVIWLMTSPGESMRKKYILTPSIIIRVWFMTSNHNTEYIDSSNY